MATLVEYSPNLRRAVDNALRGSSTSRMPPHRPGREIGTEARPSEGGAVVAWVKSVAADGSVICDLYENGTAAPKTQESVKVIVPQAAKSGITPEGWIVVYPVDIATAAMWEDNGENEAE